MSIKVIMTKGKETVNKIRYEEDGDTPTIGTLYVPKTHAKDLGDTITVEVKKA